MYVNITANKISLYRVLHFLLDEMITNTHVFENRVRRQTEMSKLHEMSVPNETPE